MKKTLCIMALLKRKASRLCSMLLALALVLSLAPTQVVFAYTERSEAATEVVQPVEKQEDEDQNQPVPAEESTGGDEEDSGTVPEEEASVSDTSTSTSSNEDNQQNNNDTTVIQSVVPAASDDTGDVDTEEHAPAAPSSDDAQSDEDEDDVQSEPIVTIPGSVDENDAEAVAVASDETANQNDGSNDTLPEVSLDTDVTDEEDAEESVSDTPSDEGAAHGSEHSDEIQPDDPAEIHDTEDADETEAPETVFADNGPQGSNTSGTDQPSITPESSEEGSDSGNEEENSVPSLSATPARGVKSLRQSSTDGHYKNGDICPDCGNVLTVEKASASEHSVHCGFCGYHSYEEHWGFDDHCLCAGCEQICHDYTAYYADKDPTCTELGVIRHWYCSRCQKNYGLGETELSDGAWIIPALGHDLIHHDVQAATCTEVGWDAYDTCSRCDYTTYKEIPALGHDWATTLTNGGDTHYYACSRCDAKKDESAHNYQWTYVDDSTCKGVCTCGAETTEAHYDRWASYCDYQPHCEKCDHDYGPRTEHDMYYEDRGESGHKPYCYNCDT